MNDYSSSFSELNYMTFEIKHDEASAICTTSFGRSSISLMCERLALSGVVEHVLDGVVSLSWFHDHNEFIDIFDRPFAHSNWFVSFNGPIRAFLDFDDDFAIILFDMSMSDRISSILPLSDLWKDAVRERAILEQMKIPARALARFDQFLAIAAGRR